MSNADDLEPYEAFVVTAERLQENGHSHDAILEGALMLALAMSSSLYGPAATASRLDALRARFAHEAADIGDVP